MYFHLGLFPPLYWALESYSTLKTQLFQAWEIFFNYFFHYFISSIFFGFFWNIAFEPHRLIL